MINVQQNNDNFINDSDSNIVMTVTVTSADSDSNIISNIEFLFKVLVEGVA